MCGIPTLAVHRPSISSFEIVRREYKNKNRGRFIYRKRKRVGVGKYKIVPFFFSRASRSLSRENSNRQIVEKKKA